MLHRALQDKLTQKGDFCTIAFCRVKMDYKIVKDNRRKKMVMSVSNDGTVIITVPKWTRKRQIDSFYKANLGWISQRRKEIQRYRSEFIKLTDRDIKNLKKQAKAVLTAKTMHYGSIMGVMPQSIKITSARKRWGSCRRLDGTYTICYSYRTMFLENRVQDYIVVHELAHMLHFDHSKDFYKEIEKVLPDWQQLEKQADSYKDYHIY